MNSRLKLSDAIIDDLKSPIEYYPIETAAGEIRFDGTLDLQFDFPDKENVLETAVNSLKKVLDTKGFTLSQDAEQKIIILHAPEYRFEEFELEINDSQITLSAADTEGIRRGIYFLEAKVRSTDKTSVPRGKWKRNPFIRHRISRCFFGPTNRAPFFIDELMNDIDYYPEHYLDKLAHEGVNGLWLTMYFRDFPSSFFPERGKDAEKRFQKLRTTVKKCARYGIKIYVFFCEPKMFGSTHGTYPLTESDLQPGMTGFTLTDAGEKLSSKAEFRHFCTSSSDSLEYLREATETLFRNAPDLGGMINIMYGEDQGACIDDYIDTGRSIPCPSCAGKTPGEIYGKCASVMYAAMRKYSERAELIGWFYAPRQRDNSPQSDRLAALADHWENDAVMMFNMESGVEIDQLGKTRNVFDYSLACCEPSKLFLKCAGKVRKAGAKIQVGCSHEDASVPYIPVPLNLYKKYKTLHENNVCAVMQCWYFGNYPGLMNRAAGVLSMEPFPANEDDFLMELALPEWGSASKEVIRAWKYFSEGYNKFPANIGFEWYGPLHNSIVWDLHLFPVDQGIAPSWILNQFPAKSGDRIGECINYLHTLDEILTLCNAMTESWSKGVEILSKLREKFQNNPDRLRDIGLAEAVGLQIKSTANLIYFYYLRENMFYKKENNLKIMEDIARQELQNTIRMRELCIADPRLGYHSEAEGHLFHPELLAERIENLKNLLEKDFPAFSMESAWIDEWTGKTPSGAKVSAAKKGSAGKFEKLNGTDLSFAWEYDDENLTLLIDGGKTEKITIEIEPCRLWPPVRADFYENGTFHFYSWIFRKEPDISVQECEGMRKIDFPLSLFEGYRRKGFPMRFNIRTAKVSFAPGTPWKERLLLRDWNPECAAWLIFEE